MGTPLALRIRTQRPATVRTLDPVDAQPVKILDHGKYELGAAALGIQIFVAENQVAAMLGRALSGLPKRAGMAKVEQTGGRRRETPAVRARLDVS